MYEKVCRTRKFNTDEQEDLDEYDAILNNPLCSIINERKEKLRREHYDDEGNLRSAEEHVILVVTWDEKQLS